MAKDWSSFPSTEVPKGARDARVEYCQIEALRAIAEELEALRELLVAGPSLEELFIRSSNIVAP